MLQSEVDSEDEDACMYIPGLEQPQHDEAVLMDMPGLHETVPSISMPQV